LPGNFLQERKILPMTNTPAYFAFAAVFYDIDYRVELRAPGYQNVGGLSGCLSFYELYMPKN
jgi:hypothetical protein